MTHCERHREFLNLCDSCVAAKRNHWKRPPLAEFLGAEPVEPKLPVQQPVARKADPDTSHEAAALKDEAGLWNEIVDDLRKNGPATEEMVLNRIGLAQRSSGSSAFARMERAGWIVNLADPLGGKLKMRNSSGRLAMVRGLPEHQGDPALVAGIMANGKV
jgi:hypothetical protein